MYVKLIQVKKLNSPLIGDIRFLKFYTCEPGIKETKRQCSQNFDLNPAGASALSDGKTRAATQPIMLLLNTEQRRSICHIVITRL